MMGGVGVVERVGGEKGGLGVVDWEVVGEVSWFGEVRFVNGCWLGVKESEDGMWDDWIGGKEVFGLLEEVGG